MNYLNFVHFVFPDSNPTGNPKSGGTHSWWSEGKLGFFIPLPHHRNIHVITEHCVSHKPDKTFHWTQKSARLSARSLSQQHRCFFQLFVIWQTFPDHSQPDGGRGVWENYKRQPNYQSLARSADTCVSRSLIIYMKNKQSLCLLLGSCIYWAHDHFSCCPALAETDTRHISVTW